MNILLKKRNEKELAPHTENRDKNDGDNSRCITHCSSNEYDMRYID